MKRNFIVSVICIFCSCTFSGEGVEGKYKRASETHYEYLELKNDNSLKSTFSSRLYKWEKFSESGSWMVVDDTLKIERMRHPILTEDGFPTNQMFHIHGDTLFLIELNYKGELIESTSYFFKE